MITDAFLNFVNKDPTLKRHLVKTVSWRLIGSAGTALLGWFITGKFSVGLQIGGMELATKMVLYFLHERLWHRIRFGRPTRIEIANQVRIENRDNLFRHETKITNKQGAISNQSFTIWLTGLSGSGKSTIASEIEEIFFKRDIKVIVLDGDNTRLGVNSDLSFSEEDRLENIRRISEICKLFNDSETIVIASFISPSAYCRTMAREIIRKERYIEVFIDAPIEVCKERDVKGLYKLAEAGKIKNFTGVSSPYEVPENPHIRIDSGNTTIEECVSRIVNYLDAGNWLKKNGHPKFQETLI